MPQNPTQQNQISVDSFKNKITTNYSATNNI